MNKIKLLGLVSLLSTGIAFATPSCDSFQIKLKNDLADDLLVTKIKLDGAQMQPKTIEKLNSKTEQVFTVNNSAENVQMYGEFVLHTISVPSKTVTIRYTLTNDAATCTHANISMGGDYLVDSTRNLGEVQYTIFSK